MREHAAIKPFGTALLLLLFVGALAGATVPSTTAGQDPAPSTPAALRAALERMAAFPADIKSEAFWHFRDVVRSLRNDPATRAEGEKILLAFLGTRATLPAKTAVCRELRVIGGAASVPVLEKLLLDKDLSDPARYALETMPGEAVDQALLRALDRAAGPVRTGIIGTLGKRRTKAAGLALAKVLDGKDAAQSAAAAAALGRIGGSAAATVLWMAGAYGPLLECAEGALKAGNIALASDIYEKILAAKPTDAVRRAALAGKIAAAGEKGGDVILGLLKAQDAVSHEAAIGKIGQAFAPEAVGPVADLLSGLPEESQVKLLAVLSAYPSARVLGPIGLAAKSGSKAVKIAALRAMGTAGDASLVPSLAQTAAQTRGEEQTAARTALWSIKGRAVDEAVLELLAKDGPDDLRSELIMAVGERRIFAGKSVLLAQTGSPSERVRTQAVKVMRIIGTPSDVPGLLDKLPGAAGDAEREEIENAAAVLALKIAQPDGRSNAVKARLQAEKDPGRQAGLVRILAKIGDDSALPAVRKAYAGPDAGLIDSAARALAAWPTATPVDDVWKIVRSDPDETHKLLALRGFIRMTALGKFRRPDVVVDELRLALESSRRAEEKRLILSVLPDFPCPEALALARSLLADAEVKAEAQAAVDRLAKRLN